MPEETYVTCRDHKIGLEDTCPGLTEHCRLGWHCLMTDENCMSQARLITDVGAPDHPENCCICGEAISTEQWALFLGRL